MREARPRCYELFFPLSYEHTFTTAFYENYFLLVPILYMTLTLEISNRGYTCSSAHIERKEFIKHFIVPAHGHLLTLI